MDGQGQQPGDPPAPAQQPNVMEMMQAAQIQANAMMEMARVLKEKLAGDRKDRFGDAGKVIRQPEIFAPATQEEIRQWQDWRLSFRSWLFFAQEDFKKDLDKAERSDKPLDFIDLSLEEHERSEKLFSILTGVLRNRPLKILRSVEDGNGIDAWRALSQQMAPRTRSRSISLLQAYLGHPTFTRDKSILEQVLGLERLAEEYKTVSGSQLADDTQLSVLLRVVPAQLRNHLQLSMEEDADYGKIREKVVSYERTTSSWSSQAVYRELDIKKDDRNDEAGPNGC